MSDLAQVKTGELILTDGYGQEIDVIKTPCIVSDRSVSFEEVIADARAAIYRHIIVPKEALEPPHTFAVVNGRCKKCGLSRAEWEFSRHKIHCGTGWSRTPTEYIFPLASRDANGNNLTNGNH